MREGRPLARPARDVDAAAVLLDDAVDDREAEPGAPAKLLGGEEGLEDLLERLLVHPDPRVGERERRGDPRPLGADPGGRVPVERRDARRDPDRPAPRQRVAGVRREFSRTCSIWPWSASTKISPGAIAVSTVTSSPISREISRWVPVTSSPRSKRLGLRTCLRLKASRLLVSFAALFTAPRMTLSEARRGSSGSSLAWSSSE